MSNLQNTKKEKNIPAPEVVYVQVIDEKELPLIKNKQFHDIKWNLNEPTFNGDDENAPSGVYDKTRWDRKENRPALNLLKQSIKKHGFLGCVLAVELFHDIEIDGVMYFKDSWLIIDDNGRMRAMKELIKEGYTFQVDGQDPNALPVADLTPLLLENPDQVLDDEDLQEFWLAIVKLNTNVTKQKPYDILSGGARRITDVNQKEIWTYLVNSMKKYNKILTNDNIIRSTLKGGKLNEHDLNNLCIKYNMNFKRYSDLIFESLKKIRNKHKASVAKAGFLGALGQYFVESAKANQFFMCKYEVDNNPKSETYKKTIEKENTRSFQFPLEGKLYSDSHFEGFTNTVDFITNMFYHETEFPVGGFSGSTGRAIKEIHEYVFNYYKVNKVYMKSREVA